MLNSLGSEKLVAFLSISQERAVAEISKAGRKAAEGFLRAGDVPLYKVTNSLKSILTNPQCCGLFE